MKILRLVVLVLLVGVLTSACGGSAELSEPEKVVVAYLEAMEAKDEVAVAACFVREEWATILSEGKQAYSEIDSIDISGLQTSLMTASSGTATVLADYDWTVSVAGEAESSHQRQMLDLINLNGEWVIQGITIVAEPETDDRSEDFAVDEEVMALVTAIFFSDPHAGFNPERDTWCDSRMSEPGHYFPTARGQHGTHTLVLNYTETDASGNPRVDAGTLGIPADTATIDQHAVWMGLLVNDAGTYAPVPGGTPDRAAAAPLAGEIALYLLGAPDSAGVFNGVPAPGGTYTWVVGADGSSFAAYHGSGGFWYAGFNGQYP